MSDLECPHCGQRMSDEQLLQPLIYFVDAWIMDEYGCDRVCGMCYRALKQSWYDLGQPLSEMDKGIEAAWEKFDEIHMREYTCRKCGHTWRTFWHPVACPKCDAPM